jgi:hypothetical protein
MRRVLTQTLTTGAIILLAALTVSAQGRGRGGGPNGPPDTPPGQDRRPISVPEPVTMTLVGLGIGTALVARRLRSRRAKPRE